MSETSEIFSVDLDALIRICQAAAGEDSDTFERELRDCGIPSALRGHVMRRVDAGSHPYDSHLDCRTFEDVQDAYMHGFDEGKSAVLGRLTQLANEANPTKGEAA